MLSTIELFPQVTPEECAVALDEAWTRASVFHLRGLQPHADLRAHYGRMINLVGEPAHIAEDATLGDRDHQRTDEVWMEVRYDPAVPNAYRHSDQPQPLHTDGSYIESFPNAGLLACVSQANEGGETIFLDGTLLADILGRRAPSLLERIQVTPVPHARSGDRRVAPILRDDGNQVILNWNYYCIDPRAEELVLQLGSEFFSFLAEEPEIRAGVMPVRLAPGEAVVWKDDRVLHGRNGFSPRHVSERFFWKAAFEMRPGTVHRAPGNKSDPMATI